MHSCLVFPKAQLNWRVGASRVNAIKLHPPLGFQLVTLACASRLWTGASSASTNAEEPLVLVGNPCYPDAPNSSVLPMARLDGTVGASVGCGTQSLMVVIVTDAEFLLVKCEFSPLY